MTATSSRGTLSNRLRLLFWVIVPLPAIVLLLTTTYQYESELRVESEQRLSARAKDSGQEVFARLADLAAVLRSMASRPSSGSSRELSLEPWRGRLDRLLALDAEQLPAPLATATGAAATRIRERLAAGKGVLEEAPAGNGKSALWMAVPAGEDGRGALWAAIRVDWLWKAGTLPSEGGVGWLLLGDGGRSILGSSPDADPEFIARVRAHADQGVGRFEWQGAGDIRWRAGFVTIPLGFDFGHPGLVAAVGEIDHLGPKAALVRRTSWLVAIGALLVAALVGGRRLRGDLEPLSALLRQTDRLATGDLAARVDVAGPTDLARLGEAFNRMGGMLQHQFQVLQTANDALRAAERRLGDVIASSPAVIYTLAVEGGGPRGITWISDNVRALLGYTAEEALGTEWWKDTVHPEDRDPVLAAFREQMAAHARAANEFRIRHRDGRYLWVRSEARQVGGADGAPAEVVGAASDITERKLLEAQVRQAQRMEALGRLAGGVAHDFNNLLTIISGYSEMVLADLPPGDAKREKVSQISQAGERGAALTRQLLAFSRQAILEPQVLDLNVVVRENEKLLRRLLGEDVRISTLLAPDLSMVKVDPGHIGQILMNVAINARDAMPTGGVLTIRTEQVEVNAELAAARQEAKSGSFVALSLTDTGTGMTPEVLARIFEPFFTTKPQGVGTGLGLATVYGIVQQSGGFIDVDSAPGRGTTFRLYFPVSQEAARSHKPSTETPSTARGQESILLVEDDAAVRTMVRCALAEAGYNVLEASRGTEALRLAGDLTNSIQLLITDVVMPEMGGGQLAEHLLRIRPEIKVLFISGYTDDAVIRQGILREEVAFLQKPFTLPALAARVRQVLEGETERDGGDPAPRSSRRVGAGIP